MISLIFYCVGGIQSGDYEVKILKSHSEQNLNINSSKKAYDIHCNSVLFTTPVEKFMTLDEDFVMKLQHTLSRMNVFTF